MDSFVSLTGEQLARLMGRRQFLRRSAAAVFGGMAAAAADLTLFPTVAHASICSNHEPSCFCGPPGIGFCTSRSSSYCSGSTCAGGCTYNYQFWSNACWCTATCCASGQLVYYQCCDCNCPGGISCGCKQLVNTCAAPAGGQCC